MSAPRKVLIVCGSPLDLMLSALSNVPPEQREALLHASTPTREPEPPEVSPYQERERPDQTHRITKYQGRR